MNESEGLVLEDRTITEVLESISNGLNHLKSIIVNPQLNTLIKIII